MGLVGVYALATPGLAALREYARRWLPGVDADVFGHGFKFVPAIGRVLADLAGDGTRPDPRFAFAQSTSRKELHPRAARPRSCTPGAPTSPPSGSTDRSASRSAA
ncbi:hypothetical protein OHA72_51375 [Dactylosporangium sp. NBC_01737]|uniref:hypothetical protein n=1 Tax=Dactylosporangium sp. NBC_01737 TaxID=2975959 RepID=UPI002E0D45BD|nr:hypothetical protein OHA72_51375 [Dactylosporangium sp. NBC_01737]